jgi:malate synthase
MTIEIAHATDVVGGDEILTGDALAFVEELHRRFDPHVACAPEALLDRRVEITGPAMPAKMAMNALNSGVSVWLADLEEYVDFLTLPAYELLE